MSDHPHLQHPPIIEALLNFEANAAARWTQVATPEKALSLFPEHTQPQILREINLEVEGAKPQLSHKVTAPVGYLLRSPSQPTVHQVRRDGYAFSRLKPYEDWAVFIKEAFAGWETYHRSYTPEAVHRVAVRFINRLEFPDDEFRKDRAAFLTIAPQVPDGLDWAFYGFAQAYAYVVPGSVCVVNVRLQRQMEPGLAEASVMTLDIEVAMKESLSAAGMTLEEVLSEMRRLKNDAFFSILTERAWAPYV